MEFSRPEYWSGLPFPSPGHLSDPGTQPRSSTLQADSLPAEPQGKPICINTCRPTSCSLSFLSCLASSDSAGVRGHLRSEPFFQQVLSLLKHRLMSGPCFELAPLPGHLSQPASFKGFPCSSVDTESACIAGHLGSIPGSGRSPGEGNDNPLQYSCLENPMDRRVAGYSL